MNFFSCFYNKQTRMTLLSLVFWSVGANKVTKQAVRGKEKDEDERHLVGVEFLPPSLFHHFLLWLVIYGVGAGSVSCVHSVGYCVNREHTTKTARRNKKFVVQKRVLGRKKKRDKRKTPRKTVFSDTFFQTNHDFSDRK